MTPLARLDGMHRKTHRACRSLTPAAVAGYREQYTPAEQHDPSGYATEYLTWVTDRDPEQAPWHPRDGFVIQRSRNDRKSPWRLRLTVGRIAWDSIAEWYARHEDAVYADLGDEGSPELSDDALRSIGIANYLRAREVIPAMVAAIAAARAAWRAEQRRKQGEWERARETVWPRRDAR